MNGTIICVLLVLIAAVFLIHYRNVRRIRTDHKRKIARLNNSYHREHVQILKRESGLNGYDFLTYNLRESLVVQSAISIDGEGC
jgi:uncharacterized protein YxeA